MYLDEFSDFVKKLMQHNMHDGISNSLVHSSMGMSEESGEILGIVKKCLWYGKELDKAKAIEEAGDLIHYLQMFCNSLGITIEDLIITNMGKLNIRYPHGYSNLSAIHRDKEAEAKIFTGFVERLGI